MVFLTGFLHLPDAAHQWRVVERASSTDCHCDHGVVCPVNRDTCFAGEVGFDATQKRTTACQDDASVDDVRGEFGWRGGEDGFQNTSNLTERFLHRLDHFACC